MDDINNLNINTQVRIMADPVNYVLSPFEGNTNTGYPQGLNIYLQSINDIYKESNKLYI